MIYEGNFIILNGRYRFHEFFFWVIFTASPAIRDYIPLRQNSKNIV